MRGVLLPGAVLGLGAILSSTGGCDQAQGPVTEGSGPATEEASSPLVGPSTCHLRESASGGKLVPYDRLGTQVIGARWVTFCREDEMAISGGCFAQAVYYKAGTNERVADAPTLTVTSSPVPRGASESGLTTGPYAAWSHGHAANLQGSGWGCGITVKEQADKDVWLWFIARPMCCDIP